MNLSNNEYKEINDNDLSLSLRKASRIVSNIYNECILKSGTGINSTQLNTLIALLYCEGKNITYIADELCLDRTTLSRNLSVLKRDNLVDFRDDKSEGRCKIYFLTESGKLTIKKCIPFLEKSKNNFGESTYLKLLLALKNFLYRE